MNDLVVVEKRLEEIKAELRLHLKRQWADVITIGKLAVEAKELLPYGQFYSWIQEALVVTPRTIQSYMRFYEKFSNSSEIFSRLPITAGLLLAYPSVPDGVFSEIERRLAAGERFSVAGVENILDKYRVLEGVHVGGQALLQTYGAKPDGTPVKQINRSAVTSAVAVTGNALERGTIEVDGEEQLPPDITSEVFERPIPDLPKTVQAAVTSETKRRQEEHISDKAYEMVARRQKALVATFTTNDHITFKIPGIGDRLAKGEIVWITIERKPEE